MSDTETVFRLRSLDTNKPSKYLLSVFFPMPFQMGKNVFLVDRLVHATPPLDLITGTRDDGDVVVQFPGSFQYMLVNRDQYEVISMEEAKKFFVKQEEEERLAIPELERPAPGYK